MTARAYTVDKRGRKRMASPRRERQLVDTLVDRAPKSGRGLWGCEFRDTYNARVRCSDSSSTEHACMWLWVEGGDIADRGGVNDGSVHLSQEQAGQLAAVLMKFARDGHLRILGPQRAKKGGER